MSDSPAESTAEKKSSAAEPQLISTRERITVQCAMWTISLLIHFLGFVAIGTYIDLHYNTDIQIDMNWSDTPLTGFGMMEEYADDSGDGEGYEPPPPVEAAEDPFDEEIDDNATPALDPDSIIIPEPEPEPDAVTEPVDESLPAHDLRRQKARLAAVKADVASMPNLHVLAPGNARVIVLIRNDRLKGSRFENSVRRLFRAFPDYRVALGASEIDPVNDIHAMLIATANPNLYAETFLVVSHDIPTEKLKSYISASFPTRITWGEHNGRPLATPDASDGKYSRGSGIYKRSLYLADEHTVLFLKPEVLPSLDVAHVDAIVGTRDEALQNDAQKKQTFLESLGSIAQSDSVSMPTLFLMVQGIDNISLGRAFPAFEAPSAMTGSLSTADNPRLNMQALFKTPQAAKEFTEKWPDIVSAASGMGIPGVGGLLKAISLTNEDNQVLMSGDLNGSMIGLVLMFAASFLERNSD